VKGLLRGKQAVTRKKGGLEMKSNRKSKLATVLVAVTAMSVLVATGGVANAATKSITCYKGTAVKKVTGASPKCAKGWTTKKPVTKATSAKVTAFSGTYKGKLSLLWSDSDVKATSATGTGTGTTLGLSALSGTGSSAPTDQCAAIFGSGVLSGGGNTLNVSFNSSAKACAGDSAAPTTVDISGNAVIKGGTGKFVGATGTLKFIGSFGIKSTAAGSSESTSFTLTVTGNINTK